MRDVEIVDRAAFLRAIAGKKPHASGPRAQKVQKQSTDKDSPTATLSGAHSEPGEGDRHGALMRLSALHYYVRWRAGAGFDCWSPYSDVTTTPHARYADAVQAAERELRER